MSLNKQKQTQIIILLQRPLFKFYLSYYKYLFLKFIYSSNSIISDFPFKTHPYQHHTSSLTLIGHRLFPHNMSLPIDRPYQATDKSLNF